MFYDLINQFISWLSVFTMSLIVAKELYPRKQLFLSKASFFNTYMHILYLGKIAKSTCKKVIPIHWMETVKQENRFRELNCVVLVNSNRTIQLTVFASIKNFHIASGVFCCSQRNSFSLWTKREKTRKRLSWSHLRGSFPPILSLSVR